MKTIKFSDEELLFLRQQYTDELANVEKYIVQVREVLKKLGGPSNPVKKAEIIGEEIKIVKKRGRKPKVKPDEPKVPKKRGRKPKVKAIVPEVPKKRGRPFKVATALKTESASVPVVSEPKKRGRKPSFPVKSGTEPESSPVKKFVKKPTKRRFSGKRRSKKITLVSLRKPLQIKPKVVIEEPVVEKEEEFVSGSGLVNQSVTPDTPSTE